MGCSVRRKKLSKFSGEREVHVGFLTRGSASAFARSVESVARCGMPHVRVRTYVYRSGFEFCVNVVRLYRR